MGRGRPVRDVKILKSFDVKCLCRLVLSLRPESNSQGLIFAFSDKSLDLLFSGSMIECDGLSKEGLTT